MSHHRSTAAVGDDSDIVFHRVVQQCPHLFRGLGKSHAVGKGIHATAAHFQHIRQALAAGVTHADLSIRRYQGVFGQARGRYFLDYLLKRRTGQWLGDTDQRAQHLHGAVAQRDGVFAVFISPAIPVSHLHNLLSFSANT